MSPPQTPTLKLIVVDPAEASALSALGSLDGVEVRELFGNAYVACTVREPADLRDVIAALLPEGASCLVTEFEKWSGYGPAIDAVWLMRRGH